MQVWDLSPGYLNDTELLEQRDLIATLLTNKGERPKEMAAQVLRWSHCLNALRCMAAWVGAECRLRALAESEAYASTLLAPINLVWPKILKPGSQLMALSTLEARVSGRIPVPQTTQGLWTQHKYSVAARSMEAYRVISVKVAAGRGRDNFDWVAEEVIKQMQLRPAHEGLRDVLMQMWGYVAGSGAVNPRLFTNLPQLLAEIQQRAQLQSNHYLLSSTALSELSVWLESPNGGF